MISQDMPDAALPQLLPSKRHAPQLLLAGDRLLRLLRAAPRPRQMLAPVSSRHSPAAP